MPPFTQTLKDLLRRGRHRARQLAGREVRHGVQVRRNRERLGTVYGGWTVCPDALGPDSVVYSVGVGEDVSWDLAMVERFGTRVWAFDPTPRSIAWVAQQRTPERWHFHGLGIADYDGTATFHAPAAAGHVSYSMTEAHASAAPDVEAEVCTLRTLTRRLGHGHVDVLKMDIEGAEYGVIDDVVRSGVPVRQLLVEFHHFFPGVPVARTEAAIETLNAAGFRIFDVSPGGYEYSFIRD